MATKRLLLQDSETGINYSLLLSEEDYKRALEDNAFAHSLLFHARANRSFEDKENAVSTQETVDNNNDENANDKPSGSTEGEEGGNFSAEATKLFLSLWFERKDYFRDPTIKKKKLFGQIAEEMQKHNYHYNIQDIERKYRNMKQYYLKLKDNNNKTGRGRKSWPYYELVDAILECDRSINPPALMSSMGLSHQQKETVEDHVASIEPPSGFDLIAQHHPTTEMLPERAALSDVREAVKKRRLHPKKVPSQNVHIKPVRKSSVVKRELLVAEQDRNNELKLLRSALEKHNDIQTRRNELLEKLLNQE